MKRPAMLFCLCYIAGVLTKLYVNLLMAMIGIIAIVIIICLKMNVRHWRYLLTLTSLFLIGFLNMTRVTNQAGIFKNEEVNQSIEVIGEVIDADISKNKVTCKLTKVLHDNKTKDTHIKVLIYSKSMKGIHIGDCIRAKGNVENFLKPSNPGGFNARNYYYAQGIFYMLYCGDIEVIDRKKINFNDFSHDIRINLEQQLYKIFPEKEASILCTMLLGTNNLDQDTKELYQIAGISHLLAISGLHITIIGMGFFHILKKLINIKVAVCLSILLLIIYSLLTGCSASTIRASIMLILMLLTIFFCESYDGTSALFLSALGMLIINPYQILDIGFLLSFSAVGGILWLTPVLNRRFNLKNNALLQGLFVSLGATLTTLPIISWYFYTIPLYALLINLLVVPVTSLIIGMAIITLTVSFFSLKLSCIFGGIVYFALKFIEGCCVIVTQLPFSGITIGRLNYAEIIIFYGALYLFMVSSFTMYKNIKIASKVVCVIFISIDIFIKIAIPSHQLKMTFLDVGQGDSAVIEYMNKVFLIDGGGQTKAASPKGKNTGAYILAPYLASQGINHINGIFISHSDFDHIYGIIEIIAEVETDFIVLPKPYESATTEDSLLQLLIEGAVAKGIKIIYFSEGDQYIYRDLNIYCLYPGELTSHNSNNNSNSMVLRIDFKSFNALFTGDIEIEQERIINQRSQKIVEVIKVPHHGSDTSSTELFIEQFSPSVAVFSYGKSNNFGHPSESVVERYTVRNIIDYHIAQTGAVIVNTNGQIYTINTYSSHRKDKYKCNN